MNIKRINLLPKLVDEVSSYLSSDKCKGKTIIWFGYTIYLNGLQMALRSRGQKIDFAVDNNDAKWGLNPYGLIECFPPEEIIKYKDNAIVLIASKHKSQMTAQLLDFGLDACQLAYFSSPDELKENAKSQFLAAQDNLPLANFRSLQLLELDILKFFRDFCDKHELRYFLAEGTLLGAIRHKGFIPWDDDIDVFMPYEDYKRFLSLYSDTQDYKLLEWKRNATYDIIFSRLVKTGTLRFTENHLSYLLLASCIDIFPIGGFSGDAHIRKQQLLKTYAQSFKWKGVRYLKDYCDCRESIFSSIEEVRYENSFYESKYVGMYHFDLGRITPWAVPQKHFAESIDVEFEGELFKAPKGYHEYLTARYGDYMTLPPESERFVHNFSTFIVNEDYDLNI